uniref:Histone deacetylase 14 n=1 Tax=Tanacetum cinerariifolium TaxID=118510 RepID=A0A699IX30_TANCI|nr:hypothetical protein [Tanacetum cinerariifolium]
MADMTAHTGQAPTMAPSVRINDQILPRIRWVQTRYLKFGAKGTKREVFGITIPGSLTTADLREASYYQEYLTNVTKHRRFLVDETGIVQDSPTPKPAKCARKPKSTAQKARINILREDGNPARANIKQALVGFNSLVHSLRALSALRRYDLRTAGIAAKPCQRDSSELYLITGILTVAAAGQKDVNSQLCAHSSNSLSMTTKRPTTQLPRL